MVHSVWSLWALIGVSVVLGATGPEETETPPRALPGSWNAAALLPWHQAMLVGGYLEHGQRDAKWDAAATNALSRFAAARAGTLTADVADYWAVTNFTSQALRLGCQDPLIRYLHWRRGGAPLPGTTNILAIADDLAATSYDPLLKCYGYYRAFDVLYPKWGNTNQVPPEARRVRQAAFANLYETLAKPGLPGDEFLDLVEPMCDLLWHTNLVTQYWPKIEEAITNRYLGTAEAQYLLGDKYVDFAWQARGSGWADSVTDEGWRLFGERLQRGESALRQAWDLKPTLAQVPYRMIWVCLGRSHPRSEMELWFRRGQQRSAGWYKLYWAKAEYLMPKWHGSEREVIEFGQQCLTDTNAVKRARLMIVDIHEALEGYYRKNDPKTGKRSTKVDLTYYRRPAVWRDIRAAFEVFFKEAPEASGWHHNFALHAWRAQDWKTLNQEIPLLGEVNFKYFGGQAEYERMIAEAKDHSGP
ncbi:MAG TPA: hypothetical protein PLX89_17635 [Verrucomicrobiota bacterium]|nr:hypothetical protein [Verrucomicrobiales bacterium]HRI14821.1 hypothetical protein [Verrucomicrobiota bacterium]